MKATEHDTWVDTDLESHTRIYYQAVCSTCGWNGERYLSRDLYDDDAEIVVPAMDGGEIWRKVEGEAVKHDLDAKLREVRNR